MTGIGWLFIVGGLVATFATIYFAGTYWTLVGSAVMATRSCGNSLKGTPHSPFLFGLPESLQSVHNVTVVRRSSGVAAPIAAMKQQ